MESTVMETAISQGIWAVLAVFLLIYIVKSNEQRDAKQEEREKNYQTVIENLTEKFQILNQVQNDLKEIKDNLLNKNQIGKRNRSSLYKMNVTVGRAFVIQVRKQINSIYRQNTHIH